MEINYVLVNTTKSEKIFHLNRAARLKNLPMMFLPITVLGKPAHSAEEDKNTYTGNLADKVLESRDYLREIIKEKGEDYVFDCLGIKPDERRKKRIIIAAEDSGISVDPINTTAGKIPLGKIIYDNIADPAFAEFRPLLESIKARELYQEGRNFPGVETVHVLPALGGAANFAKLLKKIAEKFGFTHELTPGVDLAKCIDIEQASILGGFLWHPGMDLNGEVEELGYKTGFAKTSSHFTSEATASPMGEIDFDGIAVPTDLAKNAVFLTRHQLGGLYDAPQARAEALTVFAKELHINRVAHVSSVKLPNVPNFNIALLGARQSRVIGQLKAKLKAGYGQIMQTYEWPENLDIMEQGLLDNNDCFVFMPLGDNLTNEEKISHTLRLAYVLVHKAIDPEGKAKPVIIWDPDYKYKSIVDDLVLMFNRGVYSEKLSLGVTFVHEPERAKLQEAITNVRDGYYRVPSDPKDHDQVVPELEKDRFNVAIFCSASMDGHFYEKSKQIAHDCFMEGYGVVWGEGDRHMMGGVYDAYKDLKAVGKNDLYLAGSTTNNIAETETKSGRGIDDLPTEFRASTISKRLQFLMQSDAFVFLEGGAGTLQEMLTLAYYRKKHPQEFADKPIVLQETALNGDRFIFEKIMKDIFEVDIRGMSAAEQKRNHIYLAKGPEDVKTILSSYGAEFARGPAKAA